MIETQEEQRVEQLLAPLRRLEPAGLPPMPRRRRARWIVAVAVPLGLAALLIGLRPGSGSRPSPEEVLARAAAALAAPADSIRHTVQVDRVDRTGCTLRSEWWTTTSPPFQERTIQGYADGYQIDWALVRAGETVTEQLFDPAARTIYEATTRSPNLQFEDPAAAMRRALDAGTAKITGERTLDGQAVWVVDGGGATRFLIDQDTYETVEFDVTQNGGSTSRRMTADYAPATIENLTVLDERAAHPGSTVVSVSATDWQVRSQRLTAGHPWCTR